MESIEIDGTAGTVTLRIDGTYTAETLRRLMHSISDARAKIAKDPPQPTPGTQVVAIAPEGLAYWAQWPVNDCSLVAMRHPGLGWIGMLLTPLEAARLAKYLNEHLTLRLAGTAPSAPSTPTPTHEGGNLLH
jgi:hypothetical protein